MIWAGLLLAFPVPYQQIMQLTLEAQTDLVIMGVRGRGALHTALLVPQRTE